MNEILQQSSTTSSYQAAVPPCRLVDGIVAYNAVSNMKLAGEVVEEGQAPTVAPPPKKHESKLIAVDPAHMAENGHEVEVVA